MFFQKEFNLSEARAMFMPHKVPQNGDNSDTELDLRKLTGKEIWELTEMAAIHDYQRTSHLARRQFELEQ